MNKTSTKREKLSKKLLHKYRLVILNEDTFEERISFKLTRLNVFVLVMLSAVFLVAATTILIAFTPLREYIPGYSSTALRQKSVALSFQTDSLKKIIDQNEKYYASIKQALRGEVVASTINKDSIIEAARIEISERDLLPSSQDSILRQFVEKEDKYSFFDTATAKVNAVLFPPVNGVVSEVFSVKDKHYAIDIVVKEGTPVKSAADGIVIFSSWTNDTGNVIIVEHAKGLTSVYKHNSTLTKRQGDLVKAGEVVATSGNTGTLSTGPHLHFELWNNGYAVNPQNFISF